MSEQQSQTTSACPHPEAVGLRWEDPISDERQAELQGYLDRWEAEADHGERKGPFAPLPGEVSRMRLTGADVFWLVTQSRRDERGRLPDLHLEQSDLSGAHLEQSNLSGAHLEEAGLRDTHLEGANVRDIYLEKADLLDAYLEGANLGGACLEGVDLRYAWFDGKTVLSDAILDDKTRLADIQWNGVGAVNLTRVNWARVPRLGDEYGVGVLSSAGMNEVVVRAYRQMATQLRAQGISEVADRFLYRSQIWQRRVLIRQGKLGGYLFSLLLAALSGYGYRLGRIIVAYALIVSVFAAAFLVADVVSGQAQLTMPQALDALQISLNAVNGRVFFAQFHLDTLQSWLATAESIVGVVIEGVFIAMLIQRFFGR